MDHHEDKDGDMSEMEDMMSPLMGQLTYLVVSGLACSKAGLELFRYRSATDYYAVGDSPYSWNPWKIANLTEQYFGLVVWGVLFVFQIMSLFGVLANINLMLWYWSGMIGGFVMMVTMIFRFIAYEGAYTEDSNSTITNMVTIKTDTAYAMVSDVAFGLALM